MFFGCNEKGRAWSATVSVNINLTIYLVKTRTTHKFGVNFNYMELICKPFLDLEIFQVFGKCIAQP